MIAQFNIFWSGVLISTLIMYLLDRFIITPITTFQLDYGQQPYQFVPLIVYMPVVQEVMNLHSL